MQGRGRLLWVLVVDAAFAISKIGGLLRLLHKKKGGFHSHATKQEKAN